MPHEYLIDWGPLHEAPLCGALDQQPVVAQLRTGCDPKRPTKAVIEHA